MKPGSALPPLSIDPDVALLADLWAGREEAFAGLVDRYHASMTRVARAYVASRDAAEDVVEDAWIGIIQGPERWRPA